MPFDDAGWGCQITPRASSHLTYGMGWCKIFLGGHGCLDILEVSVLAVRFSLL